MATHTPGPYVSRPVPGMAAIYIGQDGYMPHASVFNRITVPGVTAQMEADARLLVAAPELLDVVRKLADGSFSRSDLFRWAREAIAKVDG